MAGARAHWAWVVVRLPETMGGQNKEAEGSASISATWGFHRASSGSGALTKATCHHGGGRRRRVVADGNGVPDALLHGTEGQISETIACARGHYWLEGLEGGSPERQIDNEEGQLVEVGKSSIPATTLRGGVHVLRGWGWFLGEARDTLKWWGVGLERWGGEVGATDGRASCTTHGAAAVARLVMAGTGANAVARWPVALAPCSFLCTQTSSYLPKCH